MATSIDDLLTVLDHETASNSASDPRDAARALHWCSRLLTYLRTDGIAADIAPKRDDAVRRLAEACADSATAFEHGQGRHGDLVAVTHDAVQCLRRDTTDSDRWTAAIRLAVPARRWAVAIARSGPYADVPQLLSVADRSTELLHVAAASTPNLAELNGHDLPIPTTLWHPRISPARAVVETTANLAAEFRLRGREPMTVRELVAVSHAAARVAAYVEANTGFATSTEQSNSTSPSDAWRTARNTLALYADGARLARVQGSRSQVMIHTMRVDVAVQRTLVGASACAPEPNAEAIVLNGHRTEAARVMRSLQLLAAASQAELIRIRPMIFVPHGPKPLHESRVGEWLRHRTFAAQPPDLIPAVQALEHAAATSVELANAFGSQPLLRRARSASRHRLYARSSSWRCDASGRSATRPGCRVTDIATRQVRAASLPCRRTLAAEPGRPHPGHGRAAPKGSPRAEPRRPGHP
jgi:hypothetical protein